MIRLIVVSAAIAIMSFSGIASAATSSQVSPLNSPIRGKPAPRHYVIYESVTSNVVESSPTLKVEDKTTDCEMDMDKHLTQARR